MLTIRRCIVQPTIKNWINTFVLNCSQHRHNQHLSDSSSGSPATSSNMAEILLVEPFYGGSHAQLMDLLINHLNSEFPPSEEGHTHPNSVDLVTMTDKKWHWRARTSALWLAMNIPKKRYKKLFISSVINLAELIGLRTDLANCDKVLYFHENQLEYPVQEPKFRDYQYGYNQILSALVADKILFNSEYNMTTFLAKIDPFLNKQPHYRTPCRNLIAPKCSVLYFPITIERMHQPANNSVLHIVWPHRWEHDKGPEEFFTAMEELKAAGCDFKLIVLGQSYNEVPETFEKARVTFASNIVHWGYAPSKTEFLQLLRRSDIAVSTALHEFYGVAMLESAFSGALPLVPNRLSYPELFPKSCIYNTRTQLVNKLKEFCRKPLVPRRLAVSLDLNRYHWSTLKTQYQDVLTTPAGGVDSI